MSDLIQDLRYALRGMSRSPGFTLTAVLTLALGIGATTAIFSAVYTLLIRPLPYHDSDRLVWVSERSSPTITTLAPSIREPDMVAWRERGEPLQEVTGYDVGEYTLTVPGDPLHISAAEVSANFLSVLGIQPQLGRDFIAADDRPSSPPVALLFDHLWRERFRSDPNVIGSVLNLDGKAYTIVGVLPPDFRFPDIMIAPQVLLPLRAPGSPIVTAFQSFEFLIVIARLHPGESPANVQAELQSFQQVRLRSYPAGWAKVFEDAQMEVMPLQRHLAGDSRTPLLVLFAAVGFVLLIACANIANLQLVRGMARRHEVAVRGALGAGRRRLARQFLTESMLVSALSASAGLATAAFIVQVVRGWHNPALPWLDTVTLDPYVFGFTLGVAVLAALLFGAAPAVTASRVRPMEALKGAPLRISGGREHHALRNAFVVGEVALAMVLLIGASLLVRSFRALISEDPGFDPHNVLTARVQLPLQDYTGPHSNRVATFTSDLVTRLKSLPGVRYVGITDQCPHSLITS